MSNFWNVWNKKASEIMNADPHVYIHGATSDYNYTNEVPRNYRTYEELTPVVKCRHCGQWAAVFTACAHCGAPVDPER